MAYTTVNEVAAELGGVTINSNSTPTATQVDSWIQDVGEEIDSITGMTHEETSLSGDNYEYVDYSGNGRIILDNYPIISVEKVEFLDKRLGSSSPASWVELSEGRTLNDNYIVYKEEGLLSIHNHRTNGDALIRGQQNVRVQYTYGKQNVPAIIKRLATLMVAKRYIQSRANSNATASGGMIRIGAIDVSDPTNYVLSHLDRVQAEEQRLLNEVVGKFKSNLYRKNIFDD